MNAYSQLIGGKKQMEQPPLCSSPKHEDRGCCSHFDNTLDNVMKQASFSENRITQLTLEEVNVLNMPTFMRASELEFESPFSEDCRHRGPSWETLQ